MSKSLLTFRLNTYFAVLILTVFGAAASLLIVHTATDTASSFAVSGGAQALDVYLNNLP